MKEFVFWQDSLSIHQSAFIRSLASLCANVTLVVWDEIDPSRKGTGWQRPDFGRTRIVIKPTEYSFSEMLTKNDSSSVHVFSGTRAHPMVWNAFRASQASKVCIGIYSEAQNGTGLKGLLRLVRSACDSVRFRERVSFILATGSIGVEWFRKSGYPPDKIFPFGYFVETPLIRGVQTPETELSDGVFDLIFVGQLVPRKGWDTLLHALHGLKGKDWRLHVVGDGKDRNRMLGLSERLGLTQSVHFHGNLLNSEAIRLISKSDLLVLPSRWDGWGAVVSEALMLGVPVVCSDKCGAADLLDGHERGEVFSSGSVAGLQSILLRRVSRGKKDVATSEKIIEWSNCLNGQSAADYFVRIVNSTISGSSQPKPPWSQGSLPGEKGDSE